MPGLNSSVVSNLTASKEVLLVAVVEEMGLEYEQLKGVEQREVDNGKPALVTFCDIVDYIRVGYAMDYDDKDCAK